MSPDGPAGRKTSAHVKQPGHAPVLQLQDEGGVYVSVGDLIAEKYRVERVLGVGGMAFVLSAKHVELDELFALKFLARRFTNNPSIIERFTQEAKAACKIRSEHVARVHDVGIHEGAPFFVMEHLEGRDLSAVVAAAGPLRVDDAVEYAMQACEALAVAHCHGIVHRDIKPENLFLVEREGLPIIKLLDFGISKVVLAGGDPPTRPTGDLTLGTPCYMSPEQIRSTASADARSDLWSLGAVLYELLTGIEAFRAASVNEVCAAVLEREPQPPCELRPEIPHGLADVIAKCLEKDADDRFADVAELATALLPFAPTRALVSAERACSVMRGARRAHGREQHVSSVRPSSLSASSRRHASDVEPIASAAPVARSIEPPPAALAEAVEETGRRGGSVALAVAAFAVVLVASGLAYAVRETREPLAPIAPAAADVAESSPFASAPTANRPARPTYEEAATEASTEGAVAPAPMRRRPAPPTAAPPPSARAVAPRVAAPAPALPSSSPSSSSEAVRHAPNPPAPAPAATPSVELGY